MESIAIAVCVGMSLLAIGVLFCAKGSDNTDRGIGEDESRIAEPLIFSRGVEAQRTNNNNNNNNSENQRREPERYQQREINITSSPTAAASVAASVPKFVNRSTGSKQSSTSSNVADGDVENEFIGAGQVDSRKSKSTKAAGAGVSAIFCGCGGPGSLVKLKPCGCRALCLSCAQIEKACPQCNAGITDSVPSFRVTLE